MQRIRILFVAQRFTVEEIRPVVSMLTPEPPSLRALCADVITLYGSKLGELDERIAALQAIRASAAERLAFLEEQRCLGGPDEPPRA